MDNKKSNFIYRWSLLVRYYFPFVSKEVGDFIACQFALESAYGTSSLAIEYNNFSGMKIPFTRLSCAFNVVSLSNNDKFAYYHNDVCCLVDYFFLFEFNKIGRNMFQSLKSFKLALVQIGYCPEKDYVSRIESIYNQFINSKNL